jgi:hypothetical protein
MASASRDDKGAHQRRVLEHQTRLAAERRAPDATPADPQLSIPLVGEVKRADDAPKTKRKKRARLPDQLKFGEL